MLRTTSRSGPQTAALGRSGALTLSRASALLISLPGTTLLINLSGRSPAGTADWDTLGMALVYSGSTPCWSAISLAHGSPCSRICVVHQQRLVPNDTGSKGDRLKYVYVCVCVFPILVLIQTLETVPQTIIVAFLEHYPKTSL